MRLSLHTLRILAEHGDKSAAQCAERLFKRETAGIHYDGKTNSLNVVRKRVITLPGVPPQG